MTADKQEKNKKTGNRMQYLVISVIFITNNKT